MLKYLFRRRRRVVRRRSPVNVAAYRTHKESARALVHERLAHWNQFFGFTYNGVAIRKQRSRLGSCSSRKNLNFNYRIVFLPIHLTDYIIVHELCHLAHMNHSQTFWDTVATVMPNYEALKKELHSVRIASLEKRADLI